MNEPKVMQDLHQQMEKSYDAMKSLSSENRIKKITAEAEIIRKNVLKRKKETTA
jgi:hypothetical protein